MKNLMLAGILLTQGFVAAQTPDTVQNLKGVEIVENRLSMPFSKTNRNISILQQREIATLPVYTPQEALSYVSGVDIRQRGVMGTQADIGIRGGSFEQTQVLINGIKLSDPQTAHHTMNLPIPVSMLKRVEVLKGPGAVKYGQNAFSGVVNLVTQVPEERKLWAGATGGEFGTYVLNGGVALPGENIDQMIGIAHQSSDGYRPNADFDNTQAFYNAQIDAGDGKFELMGGGSWRKFGAGGFYVPDSEEYEEVNTAFGAVTYKWQKNNLKIEPRAYYRYNDDHYVFIRDNPEVFQNFHFSNVAGTEIHSSYTSKAGVTGFGLEYRHEQLNSTNLGERQRNIAGLFLEHRFYFGGLSITPGYYLNRYSDFGYYGFPSIDAGYELSNNWTVYGSTGKSFRIPSYTDLYYRGQVNIGNPDLEPEEAWTYEGGFKFFKPNFYGQAGVFQRDASQLIDWVKFNPADPWQPQNFYNVNVTGIETQVKWTDFNLLGIPVNNFKIDYTYIQADLLNTNAAESRYSLSNLRHQAVAQLTHKLFAKLHHSIAYRYLDRVTLPSYHLLDYRIFWKAKKFDIFVDASNVTGTQYTEAGFVPMPGRWFKAGIRVQTGF